MFGCKQSRCCIRRRMTGVTDEAQTMDLMESAEKFHLNTGPSLAEASEQSPVALVFLRHFGCTFTRQILRSLEVLQRDAEARGARLVLVHMLKQGDEVRYLGDHREVACIADPKCQLYRAFGLGNGGILELFGPRVWWLGMASVIKGCGVGHLAGNGLQMPGAFLFHRGKITAAQRARTAADLPDLQRLFDAADSNPSS